MVRYFENPYEDYECGAVAIYIDTICGQINEYLENITKRLPATRSKVDGGLYVGVTGVSFMFYHLAKNLRLSENKSAYLAKALEYLSPALEVSAGDKTSFLLGDAGTYALSTVLYKEMGDGNFKESLKQYQSLFKLYLNPKFLKCGGDEFFVGRAGYLAGALWLTRELQTPILSPDEWFQLCNVIVDSGREYSSKFKSPCPLMYHYYNTEYLGAAHGLSFILQMLLTVPGYISHNKSAAHDIKTTIDYMVFLQTDEGNWPACMEERTMKEHKLVHWCHGAPGVVYLMAKAYLVYQEQKYLEACIKAAELIWKKGLLFKGPGICHGVSGNGYVFLLLYRLTDEEKYLYRAKMFAEFLNTEAFNRDAKLPDNPESLYEGAAGAVCFLSDLLYVDKAEFPFQDVFTSY